MLGGLQQKPFPRTKPSWDSVAGIKTRPRERPAKLGDLQAPRSSLASTTESKEAKILEVVEDKDDPKAS